LFWVDGGTNLAAALMLWLMLKPVNHTPPHPEAVKLSPAVPAYRDKAYMYFILITTLFAACFFQLFTNLPVFFKKEVHLSEPFIGFIMAVNGVLIALFEMVLVFKLEGRRKNIVYIVAGVLFIGFSFMMLNIPGIGPWLSFMMICLVTTGEIFALPFMNTYWISRTQPSNRGQYAALYTMAWSAAQTLGPMAGAQLAEYGGFGALWWATGGLCVLSAFAFRSLKN
jgi:predicted MFS family arabinose efflux permease